MRGVAGVLPLNTRTMSWVVAVSAVAVVLLAGLYAIDRVSPSTATVPRSANIPPEPSQTSNRDKKAARETGKMEARLAPEIAAPKPEVVTPMPEEDSAQEAPAETGRASWYDLDSKTASGEDMDGTRLTAAHPSLPLGTKVRVENLDNGRVVVVRINDRGPFAKDRIIDLSKQAAAQLDMIEDGVAKVRVSPVEGVGASIKAGGDAPPLRR